MKLACAGAFLCVPLLVACYPTAPSTPDTAPAWFKGVDCIATEELSVPPGREALEPGPLRGGGHVVNVVILAEETCVPVPGAQVELWARGLDGDFSTGVHTTVSGGASGVARVDTELPGADPKTGTRTVHAVVSAPGYCPAGLVIPVGQTEAPVDFFVTALALDEGDCPMPAGEPEPDTPAPTESAVPPDVDL